MSSSETKSEIVLYTASTMNGWKPVIFLEEAQISYELIHVDFSKNEQKSPQYVQLNPNGRIPTIIDRSNDDFVVFESGAILWYLAQKYRVFLPEKEKDQSRVLQWLMFQVGGVGPMMGQAMYFQRIAIPNGERHPFAIERYIKESRRLLEVLDRHLEKKTYLVNEEFTIADIAMYPWARCFYWACVSIDGLFNLQKWLERIDNREATQRALEIPEPYWAFFGRGDIEEQERQNAQNFKDDV